MKRSRRTFFFECLESRLALAGNITATQIGEDLVIVGDELGNSLKVNGPEGRIALSGSPAFGQTHDTTINGQDTSSQPIIFDGVTGSVVIRLAGGNDSVYFDLQPSSVVIEKALVIDTGIGNDFVTFIGVSLYSLQVGIQSIVDLGEGHDRFNGVFTHTTTDQIIRGGSGNDSILFQVSTCRDVAIHSGEGFDDVTVFSVRVSNSLLLDGGSDADRLEVRGVTLMNDSAIFGREGGDAIFVNGSYSRTTLLINGGGGFGYIAIRDSFLDRNSYLINEGPTQINVDLTRFTHVEIFGSPEGDSVLITRSAIEELFASLGEASDLFSVLATQLGRRTRIDGQGGFDVFAERYNLATSLETTSFEYFTIP